MCYLWRTRRHAMCSDLIQTAQPSCEVQVSWVLPLPACHVPACEACGVRRFLFHAKVSAVLKAAVCCSLASECREGSHARSACVAGQTGTRSAPGVFECHLVCVRACFERLIVSGGMVSWLYPLDMSLRAIRLQMRGMIKGCPHQPAQVLLTGPIACLGTLCTEGTGEVGG